jgi:hypothetical protein
MWLWNAASGRDRDRNAKQMQQLAAGESGSGFCICFVISNAECRFMKVLVLFVRGMHLDYLGCYGNEWVSTPALDRVAAEGIVFDRHFIQQFELDQNWMARESASPQGFLGELRSQGVKTCLLSCDDEATSTAYWDTVVALGGPSQDRSTGERRAAALEAALGSLETAPSWYLRFDLDLLLPPWKGPPMSQGIMPHEAAENALLERQEAYAAAVADVDREISQIRSLLESSDLLNDACWLITSNQGQAVDEERPVSASPPWLHEELIHVPLVVRLPSGDQGGRRVDALTQSTDVFPAIVDLCSASSLPVQGRYLLELLNGGKTPGREHAVVMAHSGSVTSWAIRTESSSVLLRIGPDPFDPIRDARVFIKPEDRWEVNNVCQHHLELVEQTRQFIQDSDDVFARSEQGQKIPHGQSQPAKDQSSHEHGKAC